MANLTIVLNTAKGMSDNKVTVSGITQNTGKQLVSRKVQIYDSGTTNLRDEMDSDESDGVYSFELHGEVSDVFRVEAFANPEENDENSQVFDFINPIQTSVIL